MKLLGQLLLLIRTHDRVGGRSIVAKVRIGQDTFELMKASYGSVDPSEMGWRIRAVIWLSFFFHWMPFLPQPAPFAWVGTGIYRTSLAKGWECLDPIGLN